MDQFYSNNDFDVNKFNKIFEEKQKKNKKEDNELEAMNKVIEKEKLHDMSFGKIFVNMKDEIFGIMYDFMSINFNSFDTFIEIFTKNNRLFYLGLFIIIICIFLYIISYLFFYPKPEPKDVNLNANLSIPNDYKFSYYPHNKKDPAELINAKNTNNILKKKLLNSKLKMGKMQNQIDNLKNKLNNSRKFSIDDEEIDSEFIPKAIKDQVKRQVEEEFLNN